MSDIAIEVDRVWKKFRKGEFHDSLRDLIPAMAKRIFRGRSNPQDIAEREFWALRDVSFEVAKGQSLGIIGPNGAGKSSMLKILSKILRPNRGGVQVKGRLSALIEVGAGFHQDLTGLENIYLNGTILGMTRRRIRDKEEEILDFAGVEDFADTPVKRYSSGMKARLGFAIAAHMEPDVLLVDEVLSVGDAKFRSKCMMYMHQLLQSDVTVIFISHLLEQVRSFCPDSLVLNKGEVIYYGHTNAAIQKYLEVLNMDDHAPDVTKNVVDCEALLQNFRFCDVDGQEVLEWESSEPAFIECDLEIRRPVEGLRILIDFATINGTFLGGANSRKNGLMLRGEPGHYHVRFNINPMPLGEGEYSVAFRLLKGNHSKGSASHTIWHSAQPRTIAIRGDDPYPSMIRFNGQWDLTRTASESMAVPNSDQSGEDQPF